MGHRCSEHKWWSLIAYAYSLTALLHREIQKYGNAIASSFWLARIALVLEPSAALNRDPTLVTSVNNTSQTVSQQSTTFEPPCLVSGSGQLQVQGCSVEVVEGIAAPQRSSTRTISVSWTALLSGNRHWGLIVYLQYNY